MAQTKIPSCSIVIAEYNNGKYFSDLYNSLIAQDIEDFEVVIVDDCSTDNTISLMEQMISKDDRFKLFRHSVNQGTGAAFNTALKHASGEIIIMLGAEDALCPQALTIITDAHKQNAHASLINFSLYHCDENLKITGKSKFHERAEEKEYFYWISKGVDTFKRSCYLKTEGFDVQLRSAVDQDICFKLEEAGEVLFIDEPVYLYRKNSKGISQDGNYFPSNLNYFTGVFNTFERRKQNGFKNISQSKFLETKVEHIYWRAFVYDRQEKYFKTFLYLIYGYLASKFNGATISERTKKEIGYSINHLIRRNVVSGNIFNKKQ